MNPSDRLDASSKGTHPLSRARQRRKQRSLLPESQSERRFWLEALAHQLTPSYDFYLSSLLAGFILAAALLVQSRALMFLGILLAPYLGPVIGIALSTATGSARFLFKSILSLLTAALFFFGLGALAGALMPIVLPDSVSPVTEWNQLQLVNFLVVGVGAGLSVYRLARSPRHKPLITSAAIAYGLFPPVAVAGFSLTAFPGSDWIVPLTTGGIHLVWAIMICIVMFILLGLPPRTLSGYMLTALIIGLLVAPFMSPYGSRSLVLMVTPTRMVPVMTATSAPTTALVIPTSTTTPRPIPTATFTSTIPLTPSLTPTQTITPIPTPILARISAPTGGGAYLRDQPDGKILSSILNGNLIEVISEPVYGRNSVIWVQIRTADGFVGWIVQGLLATATPSAGW